ncbi:hypothetical protein VTK73DRAFT_3568 [Phialemonium thermophilum]|uniref:Zn(2)-C6 fungal-type domain-containing protein n=1 Tax=Phialemonium thermophilum TaxID=223376 RepID=A0ABR3VHA2_9PEZI
MDPMESQATPSTTSPPSDPSSTARPVACLRCRHRRSYCSKDRPKCSRCRHGNYECIYEEGRKITVNETYLRLLEEKVKAYEGVPDPLSSRRKAAKGMLRRQRSAAGETGQENEIEDDQDLLEPFNKLSMGGASTSTWLAS